MFNALFVLIVFLLQLNKDQLHVVWPLGVKTNITYIEETSEVSDQANQGKKTRCPWCFIIYICVSYVIYVSFMSPIYFSLPDTRRNFTKNTRVSADAFENVSSLNITPVSRSDRVLIIRKLIKKNLIPPSIEYVRVRLNPSGVSEVHRRRSLYLGDDAAPATALTVYTCTYVPLLSLTRHARSTGKARTREHVRLIFSPQVHLGMSDGMTDDGR